MTVYETTLPGVGKKFAVDLEDGGQLVVVIHNTGSREVFRRDDPDADAEKLFELSDPMARQVGTILEGAYFQPVRTDSIRTVLDDDTVIEWVTVAESSPLAGLTLQDADVRQRTGASIIAIQRDERTIANPESDTRIEADDTLVALGGREACLDLKELAEGSEE
ncbi:cation:proton antiporter regulatory subunit [Halobacteriaceae archaeon GCM10025711]